MGSSVKIPLAGELIAGTTYGSVLDSKYVRGSYVVCQTIEEFNDLLNTSIYTQRDALVPGSPVYVVETDTVYRYSNEAGVFVNDSYYNKSESDAQNSNLSGRIDNVSNDVLNLSNTTSNLAGTVSNIAGDVDNLSGSLGNLALTVDNLSNNVGNLPGEVNNLSSDVSNITSNVSTLSNNVSNLSGDLNNLSNAVSNKQDTLAFEGTYNASNNKVATANYVQEVVANSTPDLSTCVKYTDIVNNLTTNNSSAPLGASQGVALKGLIDNITPSSIGAEPAFVKNSAFNKNFGNVANTVCEGNDARLSDARNAADVPSYVKNISEDDIANWNAGGDIPEYIKNISEEDIANWNAKQSALTFDNTPINNSNNPVTSGGIFVAIGNVSADLNNVANNVSNISSNVSNVSSNVDNLSDTVGNLSGLVTNLSGTVDNLSGVVENVSNVANAASADANNASTIANAAAANISGVVNALDTFRDANGVVITTADYEGSTLTYDWENADTQNHTVALGFNNTLITDVSIPKYVRNSTDNNWYKVIGIGDSAFTNNSFITTISIPDSIRVIGNNAFYNSSLTAVKIPDSVTTIGSEAFNGCGNLSSVVIGKGVTSIGNNAFFGYGGDGSTNTIIIERDAHSDIIPGGSWGASPISLVYKSEDVAVCDSHEILQVEHRFKSDAASYIGDYIMVNNQLTLVTIENFNNLGITAGQGDDNTPCYHDCYVVNLPNLDMLWSSYSANYFTYDFDLVINFQPAPKHVDGNMIAIKSVNSGYIVGPLMSNGMGTSTFIKTGTMPVTVRIEPGGLHDTTPGNKWASCNFYSGMYRPIFTQQSTITYPKMEGEYIYFNTQMSIEATDALLSTLPRDTCLGYNSVDVTDFNSPEDYYGYFVESDGDFIKVTSSNFSSLGIVYGQGEDNTPCFQGELGSLIENSTGQYYGIKFIDLSAVGGVGYSIFSSSEAGIMTAVYCTALQGEAGEANRGILETFAPEAAAKIPASQPDGWILPYLSISEDTDGDLKRFEINQLYTRNRGVSALVTIGSTYAGAVIPSSGEVITDTNMGCPVNELWAAIRAITQDVVNQAIIVTLNTPV